MGWFLYGLIMSAGVMGLALWVNTRNIVVSWYVWLIGALALFLVTLTVQHFFASLRELEPTAAWRGVLVMGIPALILAGVALPGSGWMMFLSMVLAYHP